MEDIGVLQLDRGRIYREVFAQARDLILKHFADLKPEFSCKDCAVFSNSCKFYPDTPVSDLPKDCNFRGWQTACLKLLKGRISKDICDKIAEINASKKIYSCKKCAVCCKLASSEFTYDELLKKANAGDSFAKQFVSVFVPYDDVAVARQFYPEYYDFMIKKFGKQGINFYYCPKCNDKNLCSEYKKRPQVCREFPTNPLVLLPKSCVYREWQCEVEMLALTLHALMEIVDFYIDKIEDCSSS